MGTIALVVLSLLILPQILKNKHGDKPQEPVLIMPEQEPLVAEPLVMPPAQNADVESDAGFNTEIVAETLSSEYGDEVLKAENVKSAEAPDEAVKSVNQRDDLEKTAAEIKLKEGEATQATTKTDNSKLVIKEAPKVKGEEKKTVAVKQVATSNKKSKNTDIEITTKGASSQGYAVQVGVFADPENVKKMQAKIALAGFESKTSSVSQGTRLRVGYFVSRQGAEQALETLKQNGLNGKIVAR